MAEINISEIFYSIEGETSMVGKPSVFVRTAGCNLRCKWCDTVYARSKGQKRKLKWILDKVAQYKCSNIVLTGGEPLLQNNAIVLMEELVSKGYKVILETNGSKEITGIPEKVNIILDIKTPSSGEADEMDLLNIKKLKKKDELKFVIKDKHDFDWSCDVLDKYKTKAGEVLFSPVRGSISFERLAGWVMQEKPQSRIQSNLQRVFAIQ